MHIIIYMCELLELNKIVYAYCMHTSYDNMYHTVYMTQRG